MLISYNWLKEYVDCGLSCHELAHELTMLGLEVESVEEAGEDALLEIAITPNRGDCLSYIGIAREVSALTGRPLKLPSTTTSALPSHPAQSETWRAEIAVPELCPRYTASIVRGVKIRPSPAWLAQRLEKSGVRPINNVVDITNYILLAWGQPLHAFDLDRLEGKRVIVRNAAAGEKFIALDGKEYTLDEQMPVIADGEKAVAIAGVMGGENSEVDHDTRDILLECACFNPLAVRYTSRRLGLSTESSYRFERGTDGGALTGPLKDALSLLQELTAGQVVTPIIDNYPAALPAPKITLRYQRVNRLLGTALSAQQIRDHLCALSFETVEENKEGLTVKIPGFRSDIDREIDLIEEIARLHGYQNIPSALPKGGIAEAKRAPGKILADTIRRFLTGCGFWEVINFSFTSPAVCSKLVWDQEYAALVNPLNQDISILRDSLLPGLTQNLALNFSYQSLDLRLFEIGRVFIAGQGGALREKNSLAIAMTGSRNPHSWHGKAEETDFYDIKGVAEGLCNYLGINEPRWERCERPHLHPGQSARLLLGGTPTGSGGRLLPALEKELGLAAQAVFVWELDLDALAGQLPGLKKVAPVPRYPAVYRDLAVVVDRDTEAEKISRLIYKKSGPYLKELHLFDVYQGKAVPAGKKSLAYSLVYQWDEGTLEDEQVNKSQEAILKALADELGAVLR